MFLNLLLQGFALALPFNLLVVSGTFFKVTCSLHCVSTDQLTSGPQHLFPPVSCAASPCPQAAPWYSSLPTLLLSAASLLLLAALPTSFFPVRYQHSTINRDETYARRRTPN